MAGRRFELTIDGVSEDLHVLRFSSYAALSVLFRCEVTFATTGAEIAASDLVGLKTGSLTLHGADDSSRQLNGMVESFTEGASTAHQRIYRCVLAPEVVKLQFCKHSRIFKEMSAPDIISEVLSDSGIEMAHSTSFKSDYQPYPYFIQYEETDLDFLLRLLEYEGITFYFAHADGKHTMVFVDDSSLHEDVADDSVLPFRPDSGALATSECVSRIQRTTRMQTGKVSLNAYDFQNPALDLTATAEGASSTALEASSYSNDYVDPSVGETRATTRIGRADAAVIQVEGDGAASRMVAGHFFTLEDHPSGAINGKYLITSLHQTGYDSYFSGGEGGAEDSETRMRFENRFECIPESAAYRPPAITPWPRMHGPHHGVVVDSDSQEINTDEYGRAQIALKWDSNQTPLWARVSTPMAGNGWGFVHVPRLNQEVVVAFTGGSALSEPIIEGLLYHAENPPPFDLPGGKTITGSQHKTSEASEGEWDAEPPVHNAQYFDDKDGEQLHVLNVAKDSTVQIANDLKKTVFNDVTREIKNDETHTVGNDQTITITANRVDEVGQDEQTTVKGNATRAVTKDSTTSIDGNMTLTLTGTRSVEVGDSSTETLKSKRALDVKGASSLSVGGSHSVNSKSSYTHDVAQSYKLSAKQSVTVEVGGSKIEVAPSGITISSSAPVTVSGSAGVTVKSSAAVNVQASATVKVKGAMVGIN